MNKATLGKIFLTFILPVIVPVILLTSIVKTYAADVPYGDEWAMVPVFQAIDQGDNPLPALWEPWNEHRIFFPKIVMATAAYITNWDIKAESFISIGFAVLSAFILYLIIRLSIKNIVLAAITMLLASYSLFSPVQSENWLWGWCLEWFMAVTAVLAMIYALSTFINRRLAFIGAVIGAVIASYSLGGSIIVWPIGFLLLILKKAQLKYLLSWAASAIATIGLYYLNYHPTNSRPGLSGAFLEQPYKTVEYFVTLFGRPYATSLDNALIIGTLSLLILIPLTLSAYAKRKHLDTFIPWIGIILFSLLSATIISIGRVGDGLYNATSSRYTTFTLLYAIGVTGLTFTLLDQTKRKRLAYTSAGIITAASIPLIISSYSIGLDTARLWSKQMSPHQHCLTQPVITDDCLRAAHYSRDLNKARTEAKFVKEKNWSGM